MNTLVGCFIVILLGLRLITGHLHTSPSLTFRLRVASHILNDNMKVFCCQDGEVCPAKLRRAKWGFCYNSFVYYAYILQLRDKTYHHGSSDNLKERIKDHQNDTVESTKNLRPIELIFYAAFTSKKLAINFEKYLKSSSGLAFRNKRLIEKMERK